MECERTSTPPEEKIIWDENAHWAELQGWESLLNSCIRAHDSIYFTSQVFEAQWKPELSRPVRPKEDNK